jgi:flavin-binding protein dodecin
LAFVARGNVSWTRVTHSRQKEPGTVWVSKISEIIGSSPTSFEAAAESVLLRANRTLRGITGFEVVEKSLKVDEARITEYRVRLRLSFDMAPRTKLHW